MQSLLRVLLACVWAFSTPSFANAARPYQQVTLQSLLADLQATPLDQPDVHISLCTRALELLKETPDAELELLVRNGYGYALLVLERYPEAFDQLGKASDIARGRGDEEHLLQCRGNMAIVAFEIGEFDIAYEASVETLAIAEKIGDGRLVWKIANNLAAIQLRRGEHEEAITSWSKALEHQQEAGAPEAVARILNNVAVAYMYKGDYEDALDFAERARHLHEELGDEAGIASSVSNLGDIRHLLLEDDKALELHLAALDLRMKLGRESEIAQSQHSLGVALNSLGNHEAALEHYELAQEIQRRLDLKPQLTATLAAIAEALVFLDRRAEALIAATESADVADAIDFKKRRVGALDALAMLHESNGDFESALRAITEARLIEREFESLAADHAFASFRATYELREKDAEIALLARDNRLKQLQLGNQELQIAHQRLLRNSLILGSFLLLGIALLGWNRFLIKRKTLVALDRTHEKLRMANDRVVARSVELEEALARITRLEGLLAICSYCMKIRDDEGDWQKLETFIVNRADVDFSHGICPDCAAAAEAGLDAAPH